MARNDFTGKVAIVTGSSRGIGRATALELAERGANVVLNGRDPHRLEQTREQMEANGHQVIAVSGDVTSPNECQRLVDEAMRGFGHIDVLINNAGLVSRGKFEDTVPEVFERVLDVNILGSVYPTLAALPHLRETCGSVTFISSVAGLRGFPMASVYSASKMALTAFAESLRVDLAGTGVHVGVVYVSFTKNDPEKRVISADGSLASVAPLFRVSQASTARTILDSIAKRRFRTLQTPLGKTAGALQWAAPRLFDRLLALSMRRVARLFR